MAEELQEELEPEEPNVGKAPQASSESSVVLRDRYRINPLSPIPDLDSPSAKAYAVEDSSGDGYDRVFALICQPEIPCRTDVMSILKGENIPHLLPLIDWGAVDWPLLGQKCMAVIYQQPLGGRLADQFDSSHVKISEYDLKRRVIEPMYAMLKGLSGLNVNHREIRPNNLFFLDKDRTELVMGECVTCPPGYNQPVVFETIERGMSSPAGRGEGGAADDLYALGVSLVFHLLGQNPLAEMTDNDLIISKIEHGTYATLCGKTRIPIPMLEPVRGFLTDDPDERWGLESLEMWLGGRQRTPMQKKVTYKSDTPFIFMDKKHYTTRTLALSFSQNITEAFRVVKNGGLEKWIRGDFGNIIMAEDYENEIELNTKTELVPVGGEDTFVSKICMILDPLAPIHFKGLSFMPRGFGWVLATEILQRGDAQRAAEALAKSLPVYWVSAQLAYSPEHSSLTKEFKQLRGFLQINDLGYGLERCLYELNKYLPCQSPFVSKEHVIHVYDLMLALDKVASSIDNNLKPVDRHIAAFVSAKIDRDISPHLKSLASPLPDKSIIGMLSLLAFLQWRLKIDTLHGLSLWIGGLLKPAVESYHSRKVRKKIQREVAKSIDTGILPELFDIIDNSTKKNKDIEGFKIAVRKFAEAESELKDIDVSEAGSSESAEHLGRQAAAMISVIISLITVSITFLTKIW